MLSTTASWISLAISGLPFTLDSSRSSVSKWQALLKVLSLDLLLGGELVWNLIEVGPLGCQEGLCRLPGRLP